MLNNLEPSYKIKFNFITIILLTVNVLNVYSKNILYGYNNFSLDMYEGFVTDKNKMHLNIIDQYAKGINLSVSKKVTGNRDWHKYYNYPEVGFEFIYFNPGNPEVIGNVFSLAKYIDLNLLEPGPFDFDYRMSLGVAYSTKVFDPKTNYTNTFFSKHINFFFKFDLNTEIVIYKPYNIYLTGGVSLLHVSNGETKLPNDGISAMTYFIGLTKKGEAKTSDQKNNVKGKIKKIRISVSPLVGFKEDWRYGSDKFLELSISSDLAFQLNKKQLLGFGMDVFYDESKKYYSNQNEDPVSTNKESLSGGISLQHQLCLYPLNIVLKTGINLINNELVNFKSYNLVGIKYFIIPSVYLSLYHKSHGPFYGDNIFWGAGYEF